SIYHQMTFFVKDMKTGLYERFDEEHFQRTFPIDTYIEWLKEIGFSKILISADFSENAPKANSERIFIRAIK
ncbi:SAM-dependent methyltransferase, partial [Butyricicoccus sp. 1XD8-22]